ncbi:MAG: hypothetical protein WDN76_11085 [Alphaproteobacteria bacterium]
MAVAGFFGLVWAGVTAVCAYAYFAEPPVSTPTPIVATGLAALAFLPGLALSLLTFIAEQAALLRANQERLMCAIAGAPREASDASAMELLEICAVIRTETAALEDMLSVVGERLGDGLVMVREESRSLSDMLASELAALRDMQKAAAAENETLGEAFQHTVICLEDGIERARAGAAEIEKMCASQTESLKAVRSESLSQCEHLIDASQSAARGMAEFDSTILKALDTLAHATSLNVSARKGAEEAATAAQDAARAVREATASAIVDAQQAARRIRADAGASAPVSELESCDESPAAIERKPIPATWRETEMRTERLTRLERRPVSSPQIVEPAAPKTNPMPKWTPDSADKQRGERAQALAARAAARRTEMELARRGQGEGAAKTDPTASISAWRNRAGPSATVSNDNPEPPVRSRRRSRNRV